MQFGPGAVKRQQPTTLLGPFIHYIQHLLTHVVMSYSHNSWRLNDLKDELKKN